MKAIEYYGKPENREVFEKLVRNVMNKQPDINPAPEQFVPLKQYTIDTAASTHGLSADQRKLLEHVDVPAIPAIAEQLAATNTVNTPVADTPNALPANAAPSPRPPASGKKPPPELGTGDLLKQAFGVFKDSYDQG
jgi:hypothetical protein